MGFFQRVIPCINHLGCFGKFPLSFCQGGNSAVGVIHGQTEFTVFATELGNKVICLFHLLRVQLRQRSKLLQAFCLVDVLLTADLHSNILKVCCNRVQPDYFSSDTVNSYPQTAILPFQTLNDFIRFALLLDRQFCLEREFFQSLKLRHILGFDLDFHTSQPFDGGVKVGNLNTTVFNGNAEVTVFLLEFTGKDTGFSHFRIGQPLLLSKLL